MGLLVPLDTMIHLITIEMMEDPKVASLPILDIRSPKEYAKGHIPGAISLPLFTDEERAVVGTTYHHEGRQAAIIQGFDITGPKWAGFIKTALSHAPGQKVLLHCWRGGMRSEAMAWALNLYGFEVYVIKGGYKAFRRWTHRTFSQALELIVLSGKTGANKTGILQQLKHLGEQVVDLEALACHQGSAYGSMGRFIQPSQEQFENNLAWALKVMESGRRIWIEDESRTIGKIAIPGPLWEQLCVAPEIELMVPLESRVEVLNRQYGILNKDFLETATLKIKKRLGPDQTRAAIEDIQKGDMRSFIRRVLTYYDKAYAKSRKPVENKRWTAQLAVGEPCDALRVAARVLEMAQNEIAACSNNVDIKTNKDDNGN